MKISVMLICTMFLAITACNSSQSPNEDAGKNSEPTEQAGNEMKATEATDATTDAQGTATVPEIVDNYLLLKNALTADNSNKAADAGKALVASFKGFNKTVLTADQKKSFEEIAEVASEHAEHIGANGGNLEHQREHFALLSKDIYDLVKAFGDAGQPLYQDFCPMYDDGKGAIWLSETKDIKNPYYGKKMLTCGKMKEEIN